MLSSHARQYVHTLYAAEPEVQVKMNELLDEVDRLK
jgi:hypothetical protein